MSVAAAARTAIALAQQVGPTGHVLGIDISAPMLARARQVAPAGLPVDFVLADATVYPFEPASFDLLVSRFGVMFFADPALVLCQYAPGAAAVGTAGLRLLARAARKSVDDGAAAGGLQTRPEAAAAGARRSRSVRVCLRGARASHSGRGRIFRHRHGAVQSRRSMLRSAAVSMRRWRRRSKSARPAARWKASRPRCARPRRIRSARRWRPSSAVRRCGLADRSGS